MVFRKLPNRNVYTDTPLTVTRVTQLAVFVHTINYLSFLNESC